MIRALIDRLAAEHTLQEQEYITLLGGISEQDVGYLATLARRTCKQVYGKDVYFRGLIEVSNICKNDCFYCGIRASNHNCQRYRLTEDEILECCKEGYALGFRTFVLQGGEDGYFSDEMLCSLLRNIKAAFPDCAVTLSLGERSYESYKRLKEAGADRYLLRHETIDEAHYGTLHPQTMSHEARLQALRDLRKAGYQVGCGFMVGSPRQTTQMLARELKFIEDFKPDMCGIGPFIPHKDTPFRDSAAGSAEQTCILLSCIRLIHPKILLPATTALASVSEDGRIRGILAGANVVMPNLSPMSVRSKYSLYDNKKAFGAESAQEIEKLSNILHSVDRQLCVCRGDIMRGV